MKNRILTSRSGFTVAEVIITIAILSILVALFDATYETVKAKVRGSQARQEMDTISVAAYQDFTNNLGVWAAFSCRAMPVEWTSDPILTRWPSAPCKGYFYCWEDYSIFNANVSRVTLRNASDGVIWSYCVSTLGGGACDPVDPITGLVPPEISVKLVKYLYCNDRDLNP